jgi:hypothetical protein
MPETTTTFMNPAMSLKQARETAQTIAATSDYASFVEGVRKMYPSMFGDSPVPTSCNAIELPCCCSSGPGHTSVKDPEPGR